MSTAAGVQAHESLAATVVEEVPGPARRRRRGWLVRRALLAADVVGLSVSFCVAEWLAVRHSGSGSLDERGDLIAFVVSLPFWVVAAKLYGLYDRDEERTDHSTPDELSGVFHMLTVCTWSFALVARLTGFVHPSLLKLGVFWSLAIVLVAGLRATARSVARRQPAYAQHTVVVGAGDVGQLIARKLLQHPEYGIELLGFVDARPKERAEGLGELVLLGGPDDLAEIVERYDVERVILAFSNDSHESTLALIRSLRRFDVQIDIVPRLFELLGPGVGVHSVEGLPLVSLPPLRLARSSKLLKRAMDVGLSVAGLIVLAPVLALVAIAIRVDSPGPVFFRQLRMGLHDRTFTILKFRTMVADAEEQKASVAHLNHHLVNGDARMFKAPNDPRRTRFGAFLRRYSLDELPQLVNVLRGEMSLVGPRPLILEEDRHVSDWGRSRLTLKPGITGPWQVLGRSDIPFAEMVKLDYLYVTGWSLWNDLKLIFRTLPVLARPSDR
jgi:exopolysaccharide biosynthesis polyprenyl glycosylphosphotransferase